MVNKKRIYSFFSLIFFHLKAPNQLYVGGNVGSLKTDGSPFKNFTSSSNQITGWDYFGGNVGFLIIGQVSETTFQLDYVSCRNNFTSSNTDALIGGIKKKFLINLKNFL